MIDAKRITLLIPPYVIMIIVIFILPFFSFSEYSIVRNTTSHLGAQNTPNAWIMNTVFFLLGITSIAEAWLKLKDTWFFRIILTIFGLSLVCVAVFQHAPISQGVAFEQYEDDLHSLFASIAGTSFTVFALLVPFKEKKIIKKVLALSAGISSTILSIMMPVLPEYKGIWQRMVFIVLFAWLIYFFIDKGKGSGTGRKP